MGEYDRQQMNQLNKAIRCSESRNSQLKGFVDNRPHAASQIKLINSIQKKPNNTGLPDNLKSGIENLSGYSMDDVKVHYNSDKPAQLSALAYAQGTDIHVAPGQEQHLPHEAWHVVQQKQGRVQPTMQLQGVNMNDNEGFEKEADVLGKKTSQFNDIPSEVVIQGKWQPATFPQTLQRRVLSVGVTDAGLRNRTQGEAIIQLCGFVAVGQTVQSKVQVLEAQARKDTLHWPTEQGSFTFNQDYGGSVQRALVWGINAKEGVTDWPLRTYEPADFNKIATAAGISSGKLAGIHPSLDNEKNKTLIAVRAFRGPKNGSMAGCTKEDLTKVFNAVKGQAAALYSAGLITDNKANVTSIEADPAEAHPNTLPTAKITFGATETVYFKGRSHAVEDALVGKGHSAAKALSSIIADANADGEIGVGMHGFVALGKLNQIAENVGDEVVPDLTSVTEVESSGEAAMQPRPEAVNAWISAAKGALLASLTATTDLHLSNIVAGRSGKKHIIDGEFLLDLRQWNAYETMLGNGNITNFEIKDFVPSWLQVHTAGLSEGIKILMANEVVKAFNALEADKTHIWNKIITPLRQLIKTPALLRVAPLTTEELLATIFGYQNKLKRSEQKDTVNVLWSTISDAMNGTITITNDVVGKKELENNLFNGMVPLFHVMANNGVFLLNKQINIGNANNHHSVEDLLILAGAAVSKRYADMAEMLRTQITTM